MTKTEKSELKTSTIHIVVPAEKKIQWIKCSRETDQKLGEFITDAVEDHIERLKKDKINR